MKFPEVVAPEDEVALATEAAAEDEDVEEPIYIYISVFQSFFDLLSFLPHKGNRCKRRKGRKKEKKVELNVPVAEVADRDDVPVAEAAAAEDDEDTEDCLAVVAVCVPVTEPDVADNDDDDEAAAAPLEVADVSGQAAIVGRVTPALFSSDKYI